MSYHAKRPVSEQVFEDQTVWQCATCSCWSRKEFVLIEEPKCPLCDSKMIEEVKNVRVL